MDEWFGVLFVIGCFVLSFVMEQKKKRRAKEEELSMPEEPRFDVIDLSQEPKAPVSGIGKSPRMNTMKKDAAATGQTPATLGKATEEESNLDPSLEEIRNAVIWSEILNRKYI